MSEQKQKREPVGEMSIATRDKASLRVLGRVYEFAGRQDDLRAVLCALSRYAVEEEDCAAAAGLAAKLRVYGGQDGLILETIDSLDAVAKEAGPGSQGGERAGGADVLSVPPESEALVAEKLLGAGILSRREYVAVVERFVSDPTLGTKRPRSMLHVLQSERFRNLTAALLFLSRDSGIPLLPLAGFAPQAEVCNLLGAEFAIRHGAIAFDSLGGRLMVGVLNPYKKTLCDLVRRKTERECIIYLVWPSEFDEALNVLRS